MLTWSTFTSSIRAASGAQETSAQPSTRRQQTTGLMRLARRRVPPNALLSDLTSGHELT